MIVRDEQEMLPDCLASVVDAVDEIVVVDTGSIDATVRIVEAAGARVVHFDWCDDFSAARNAALPEAHGEWILLLDADERLAPGAGAALRAAAQSATLDCGMLPLHDAKSLDSAIDEVLSGAARQGAPQLLPRLFRRSDDFRWQGIVHEAPTDWMTAAGRVFDTVDAPIIHLGNVDSYRVEKGKAQRNLSLLEQRCQLHPNDPVARGYLSRELLRAGELQRAQVEVQKAWQSLVEVLERPRDGAAPAGVQVASLRAYLAMVAGDHETVVATADRCERFGMEHPNLVGMRAMSLRRQSQELAPEQRAALLKRAIAGLRWCLSVAENAFSEEVMAGITESAGATELGIALLLNSQPSEALKAFQQALVLQPDMRAAQIGQVEALLDAGQPQEALAALQPLLADGGADEWALASCVCLVVGAADDAVSFLKTALSHGTPGSQASYRVERFAQLAAAFEPKN